jgi:hypothetical protein
MVTNTDKTAVTNGINILSLKIHTLGLYWLVVNQPLSLQRVNAERVK